MKNITKKPQKAVALQYVPEEQEAPILVAKGKGIVAEKIIEKAKEYGVPIQEDSSLVEVLSQIDLNQQIPPELFQLVAEILSFVYQSDQKAKHMRNDL